MALCLAAAGGVTKIAALAFTLTWTHSVEKTRWEEDWRIAGKRLELVEARVEGSGAGMEPGPGARFDGRFWRWRPAIDPVGEVTLVSSPDTHEGWNLCVAGACRTIGVKNDPDAVVKLTACPD